MFERTTSGQQNRSIFLDCDFTCYVEGGGGNGVNAPDVTFWNVIFTVLRPDLRVKCIPRGGKPILERLGRSIIDNNIQNTLVALDTDYDNLIGDKLIDRRIFYTYGYSWENDVYTKNNMKIVYCALKHCQEIPQDIEDVLEQEYSFLNLWLKLPMKADYLALRAGSSLFPRDRPGRFIMQDLTTGFPRPRKQELLKLCRIVNTQTRPRTPVPGANGILGLRYCVGHILSFSVTYLMKAIIRQQSKSVTLTLEHLRDVALQSLSKLLLSDSRSEIALHYTEKCIAL